MMNKHSALLGQDFTLCSLCARLRRKGGYPFAVGGGPADWTCDAFPDGIPARIVSMEKNHRFPYIKDDGDDGGLLFFPKPGAEDWSNPAKISPDDEHTAIAHYAGTYQQRVEDDR